MMKTFDTQEKANKAMETDSELINVGFCPLIKDMFTGKN